jgi:hypothetical protein
VAKDGIFLNLGRLDGSDTMAAYLEKWRMQLWDLAFSIVFKSDVFVDYRGANLLVKRVIYKYVHLLFMIQIFFQFAIDSS